MDNDENLNDLILKEKIHEKPRKAKDYIVEAMYRMYKMGPDHRPCTLKEVADYYRTTVQNVHGLFRTRGYEIRSKNHVIHKRKSKRRVMVIKEVTIREVRKVELLPSPDELRRIIALEGGEGADYNNTPTGQGASNVVRLNHERSI